MTYDELLAKLSDLFAFDDKGHALRAVVELHKPTDSIFKTQYIDDESIKYACDYCGYDYPCRTIQAIEKELG